MSKLEPSNPAKVTLKTIKSFLQGYTRKFTEGFGMLNQHQKEQVIWRSEKAQPCTDNGTCLYCGCDTPAKYYSDEACEDPIRKCYPAMMDKNTWEEYKKTNDITIKID